jgi:hypothetical protein
MTDRHEIGERGSPFTCAAVNLIGSRIAGSSFTGLQTAADIGHIRIGLAKNGRSSSPATAASTFVSVANGSRLAPLHLLDEIRHHSS